jgi:hypothetical protein
MHDAGNCNIYSAARSRNSILEPCILLMPTMKSQCRIDANVVGNIVELFVGTLTLNGLAWASQHGPAFENHRT